MTRLPRSALAAALVAGLAPLAATTPSAAAEAAASAYYVSPSGSDANAGTSAGAPLATIQKAVDLAPSGAVANLAPGAYRQDVMTARAGVTITGPSNAVVKGAGDARIIQVRHDSTTLSGFTVDGPHGSASDVSGYRLKHIHVMSTTPGDGVGGLRVTGMTLKNAADECLRLRCLVTGAEVSDNTITGNAGGGIKFMRTPQGPVCSTTMSGNTGGDAVGPYGSSYDPTGVCPR